jgi:hypothetical protein
LLIVPPVSVDAVQLKFTWVLLAAVAVRLLGAVGVGRVTVKTMELLAWPPTVTTTFPVVAPAGTCAVILTELQAVGAMEPADTPLKLTMLVP